MNHSFLIIKDLSRCLLLNNKELNTYNSFLHPDQTLKYLIKKENKDERCFSVLFLNQSCLISLCPSRKISEYTYTQSYSKRKQTRNYINKG